MKSIWPWILSGICLILTCWCNLNTYFIKQNTERIKKFEQSTVIRRDTFIVTPVKTDTIYIKLKN